jgi:hypothetical protein
MAAKRGKPRISNRRANGLRWSYRWDARRKGTYTLMSRATDEVSRVQSHEPRYNYMRKNFSAIVGHKVLVT